MRESYAEAIKVASGTLRAAILEHPEDCRDVNVLEGALQPMVREVARRTEEAVLQARGDEVVAEEIAEGREVERRPRVKFEGLYGVMEVESPYLSHGRTHTGARPVQDILGVVARGRSERLQRALTDFGAEESFGNAAKRFEEHYGWEVGRTSILRLVEDVAREAEVFVEGKLEEGRRQAETSTPTQPPTVPILVELDGCEIRTGRLLPAPELGKSEVRQLEKRRRETAWRDVRMGLARPLTELEPTYIGKLGKYPEVVKQLVGPLGCEGCPPSQRWWLVPTVAMVSARKSRRSSATSNTSSIGAMRSRMSVRRLTQPDWEMSRRSAG
jgi:hypothetical protein